ncbi:MAG: DUF3108 domain-containing protein [Dysgonamonadaceae bacterium]|jgi:hypothetical protein|nr:DUF3108 domain-containing protein [Dysgonamonadaceae bacterium]
MKQKEIQTAPRFPLREHPEGRRWCLLLVKRLIIFCFAGLTIASAKADTVPFLPAQTGYYAIRYTYGLVAMNAGSACYRLQTTTFKGKPALQSSLEFKTNAFFDKIFLIRDTLASYASLPGYAPLHHARSINEGHTHLTEAMETRQFGNDYTEWHIRRKQQEKAPADTILSVQNRGYDCLNIFLYLRQLDYASLRPGDSRQVTVLVGHKKTNLIIRYLGPTILERSNKLKQNAFLLSVDITNEVFSKARNAMEIWISDDEYHIPLKMKAKLKIGATEAELI